MRAFVCVALALPLACASPEPEPHTLRVREPSRSHVVEGLAFERDDGLLTLIADWALEDARLASLEIDGVGPDARSTPVVRYYELADGVGEPLDLDALSPSLRRPVPERAWILGTLRFDAVRSSGERVRFEEIDVRPEEALTVPPSGGVTPPSPSGGGGGSRTTVVHTSYVVADGCGGTHSYDAGGCEGDSASAGGCEGDSASAGGCEGDSASAGGCEGDSVEPASCQLTAARGPMHGLWRLAWPLLMAGWWNRRARRASDGAATSR